MFTFVSRPYGLGVQHVLLAIPQIVAAHISEIVIESIYHTGQCSVMYDAIMNLLLLNMLGGITCTVLLTNEAMLV